MGVLSYESTRVKVIIVKFPLILSMYVQNRNRKIKTFSSGSSVNPKRVNSFTRYDFSFLITDYSKSVNAKRSKIQWVQPCFLKITSAGLKMCMCVCARLVTQSCPTLWDPMDPPGTSVHGDYPGKNTGVGCNSLLHGIFPTQGLNPGLLHCGRILYGLNHQGS